MIPTKAPFGKIELEIEGITVEEVEKIREILAVLISSGALNIKGGKSMLHFDVEGTFMGVEVNFWPFKRRTQKGER